MHRFFTEKVDTRSKKAYISGTESAHALKVLRLKPGDTVECLDGDGSKFRGLIESCGRSGLIVSIESQSRSEKQRPYITLAAAIPKQGIFEDIIDKATQLGVDSIVPVLTERTIIKAEKTKQERKLERWQKVAMEAAKQCGCPYLPKIGPVHDFNRLAEKAGNFELTLIAALDTKTVGLKQALSKPKPENMLIFIGPEGDFTEQEVALAVANGAVAVSLGSNVLRCETAAVMLLSVINHEWKK